MRPQPEATPIAGASASSVVESLRSRLSGRTVPPYPAGLRSNTGSCIGSTDEEGGVCARSIATLDDDLGVSRYLYAGAALEPVDDMPQWRVTDVIAVPSMRPHEALQIGTCEADRKPDAALAALVDARGAGEMVTRVRWAVRLQRDSGRFVTVSAATVACINEGFGE
ncbi:hypothetical protein EER27_00610 [Lysobacter psychrotolerans]|uniref:Uncharacterized protein n=1 Tax=Montanilutibacter psychrotolerans TaxID=1327343 RepID=A0A3M8SYR5_9GAMM|nr:hypothetical protein EER27_00610 [Lysobacter psychrotolerans]